MLTLEDSWCAIAERSGRVPPCKGMSSEHKLAAEGPATAQATCGNNNQACFPGFALKYSFLRFQG